MGQRTHKNAVEYMLDDKKLLKYIHGPLGTGKSYPALWFACIAVMFDPPTKDADDEWDPPLDLGPQVKPEDFDEVVTIEPPRTAQLTDGQKATAASVPQSTKVLIVSGQNTAADDLVLRLLPMWKELGGARRHCCGRSCPSTLPLPREAGGGRGGGL